MGPGGVGLLRLDRHVQSRCSKDSTSPIDSLVSPCRDKGLGPGAIAGNGNGVDYAREHSLAIVACSDAHSALDLDNTYAEVTDDGYHVTPEGLVCAVIAVEMAGKRPNPLLLMVSGYVKVWKVLL